MMHKLWVRKWGIVMMALAAGIGPFGVGHAALLTQAPKTEAPKTKSSKTKSPMTKSPSKKPPSDKATKTSPKTVRIKTEPAAVSYKAIELPPERRRGSAVAAVLKAVDAALTVKQPLSYRNRKLPVGKYRLRVKKEGAKKWALVVTSPASRKLKAAPNPRGGGAKAKKPKKDKSSPGVKQDGAAREEVLLKVPLSVTESKEAVGHLSMEMRVVEDGKKLSMSIRIDQKILIAKLRCTTP